MLTNHANFSLSANHNLYCFAVENFQLDYLFWNFFSHIMSKLFAYGPSALPSPAQSLTFIEISLM